MKLMLGTSVLLEVCVPGRHKDTKEWFRRLLLAASPPELLVSVLTDFELRRAFHRKGAVTSLEHLEHVSRSLRFVPISVDVTHQAVALCAAARPPISDAGALVAAQALVEGAVLVTAEEELRAVQGLDVRDWKEIDPDRGTGVEAVSAPERAGG